MSKSLSKKMTIGAVLLSALLAGTAAPTLAAAKLLVVISVDQMRADYLDRYASEYTGGLKILREHGAVMADAHHTHIPTETGPGHSVIMSGQLPGHTGIIANDWYDRHSGAPIYCVSDPNYGRSPRNLMVGTLGDALKAKDSDSRVVSFSAKDRAAILMGGKRADTAVWYEKSNGEFTTSGYYHRPEWLDNFNASLKAKGGPLEGKTTDYYASLLYTPEADKITLMLVENAIDMLKLGTGKQPDLMTIGFSDTDYIGHKYGPDSPQMHDNLLSLDKVLGELIARLNARLGKNWDLALTADHGVPSVPETPQGQALGMRRIIDATLLSSAEKILDKHFPAKGKWIVSGILPHLILNRQQADAQKLNWNVFLASAAADLSAVDGVAKVYVSGNIDASDPFAQVYKDSEYPERSGDLVVRTSSNVVVTDDKTYDAHGSPYDFDTHVPMVFYGPDFKPGVHKEAARVRDLAPTVAQVIGVDFAPEGSRALADLLAHPPKH